LEPAAFAMPSFANLLQLSMRVISIQNYAPDTYEVLRETLFAGRP